ncbi:SusC/RagA family TonB-linked outer membrane protein [Pedobacter zeae]|uniref:SusC/RagA family TonB-linked outer membrane protein n=1 Tax=Pedobacter zeae TaxID=1737356 RepID=A0A7W6KD46_9SPHI|nr:TonB-dependent receptor [Pedobacter zeae]MBB4109608.1 TonB-linked SusC/RagA family outer membrane protein [Pedobacter zeae]GGH13200.1 SusC/RagA family TonB-linked outer membrane protein [Pedobacter zeae]
MKKLLQSLFVLLFFASTAIAQDRTITGTVTSSDDKLPIPGVSVRVTGTQIGTVTDANGKYSVIVPSGSKTLDFSFIGYLTKNITITASNTINVALASDSKTLSDVVVVGYGQQSKVLTTQTTATVKAESFKNMPIQTPQQALQGQAAGVNMINSSGVLGSEAQITIRGGGSISAAGRPLYVVDGVPLNSSGGDYTQTQGGSSGLNPLINISPNDIESMTVLKDASAVAIYGSRGANGVILITTKKGASGKTRISADYQNGFSSPTSVEEMMTADQFRQFRTDYLKANNQTVPAYPTASYNWVDAVIRTGKSNTVNLNASGGNEKTKFYLGGTYSDESGYTLGNNLKRLSGRLNLDHKISDKFTIGLNYSLSHIDMDRIGSENNTYAPLTAAYLQLPYITPYGPDGKFQNTGFVANVVAIAATGINKNYSDRSTGNAYLEYKIIPGLRLKTDWGIDNYGIDEKYRETDLLTPGGYAYRTHYTDNKWVNTNTLNYDKTFGKHTIAALAGYSFETAKLTQMMVEGSGFVSDDLPNVGSASTPITASENIYEWALQSFFGRLNYDFDKKYLFEASLRRDGSSRFGPNKKYGNFYAVSGGWLISNEAFFNKDNNIAQNLKLTASYGTSGNDNIGFNAYYGTFASGSNYLGQAGLTPSNVPNPDLSWEETGQLDIGLSARLFKAIDVQFNFYNKNTTGALLTVPYPYTTGYASANRNVGKMRNRGYEVSINSDNIVGRDFTWRTSFNIGFNKNTIIDLPVNPDEDGRNFLTGSAVQRAITGYSKNSFYLIRYNGINPQTGNAEWLKKDGTVTTTPLASDRVIVGKGNPDFSGGITNTFTYKNFDLSAFFNFSYGNDVYLDGLQFADNFSSGSYNKSVKLLDYWKQPGDNAFAPALNSSTRTTYQQASTKQLMDGSYLRLKTLSAGYSFPKELLQRTKLFTSLRIYFQGQNIWTIKNKDFRGDPEISANGASNLVLGQSFFALPQAKTFTFGVNIGL